MIKMISAAEARKKTTETIKELQDISKAIEIAISKGMYQIDRAGLSQTSIEVLTEMGYKVENRNPCNNYYYFIKW